MDYRVSPRTAYLFAQPSALHGAARTFDFWGVYDVYNTSQSSTSADILAVLQDWLAVEEDARHCLAAHLDPGG